MHCLETIIIRNAAACNPSFAADVKAREDRAAKLNQDSKAAMRAEFYRRFRDGELSLSSRYRRNERDVKLGIR